MIKVRHSVCTHISQDLTQMDKMWFACYTVLALRCFCFGMNAICAHFCFECKDLLEMSRSFF